MAVAEFALPKTRTTNRSTPTRWILSHLSHHLWVAGMVFVGAFGNAALAAAVPLFVGQAFNLILDTPENMQGLLSIALLIVLTQAVRGVLQLGRNFGAELLGQRLERDIREELYTSLLGKSMTFHNLQPVGDTMARATNDVREINLMFSPGLNLVIGSGNFLLLPLLVAPSYHPALILMPLLFILAYILSLKQYLGELRPVTDAVRSAFGKMNTHLSEAVDGIEIVKGHAQEDQEISRFSHNAGKFRDAFVQQGDIEARFLPLLLLGLTVAGAFLHAMILFNQGAINVGQVVGYMGLIQLFGFPTFVSLFAYSQVSLGLAGARRILDLINQKTELDRNPAGHSAVMQGQIEFQSVSFAYSEDEQALTDISIKIQPGQTVAIVGQTGSGKTTIGKLVNRIYDVTDGRVLVDGVDVRDWNLETLRRAISIIEQDVFLFSRTVAENIAFGRPSASQGEIETAAKAAQAHEFIEAFKDGYDTIVGERGVTLSGGQRQRIALARAFLTDPRILILDDSTSSIDSATEDQIQRAIFKAAQGRTTIIITHRLSQIRWADLILVVRKGQLVASGSHEHLMQSSEAYQRIFARFAED
jgi:ATP-binding cassette subfamily B protein